MKYDLMQTSTGSPWFRGKAFRIGAMILAVLAVIALVFFSRQIGDLLSLFGSKAAIESQTIIIDGVGAGDAEHFFHDGFSIDPDNSLKVENDRLMLNPLSQS